MTSTKRSELSDLAALEAITEVALSTLDLDEMLRRLIRRMVELSSAQAGAILLLEGEELVPRATYGLDEQAIREYRLPPGSGFAWRVLMEGRPLSTDHAADEEGTWLPYLADRGITSMLGVPLKTASQTIGVAHIDLREPRGFAPSEIHRFEVLADRAAVGIAHSRLLQESRQRAAALERANAELREVDRMKTEFLSMVSHELRTPLTAIIGYTDLLLRGTHGQLNERQLRHQRAVKQGGQRLLALINDLLDASRLDSGLVELDLNEVSLEAVIEQALAENRDSAAEAHLSLRVELPAHLPTVRGDHGRLVQVVSNLLTNAIKFTPAGGRIDIRAERSPDSRQVRVCVADTGTGIAPEHLAHIWDRFYQADSSVRRRYGGTGLGLSIVRRLVELHGGTVSAESPGEGRGATFCFDLGVFQEAGVVEPAPPIPEPVAQATATVLVVEDQQDNRELLATMLQEMLGVQVLTAEDGIRALEQAELLPDLILLDLIMPRMDGFQVVRRLKAAEHTRHIPVLALTALTRPTEREEAREAGCDGLIVKPFDTDELIQMVERQLSREAEGGGREAEVGRRKDVGE